MSETSRKVLHAHDPVHAHLVAGLLLSHGIGAVVVGDDHPWANGGDITVHVAARDAERAAAVVAEIEANRSHGAHWMCPECELFAPTELVTCPACGTLRPPRRARS